MKRRITILMTAFLLMFSYAGLAQVVSGTTYSTLSTSSLPEGWSGEDGGGTNYIKLIAADHFIQTASFGQNGFTSITIKARKFGGPSAEQAQISVSWYDSEDVETVLGTIDPTNTTLTNYTISNPATTTSGMGYIKIQNKNASSNKGSGVSEVTITYTEPGGTQPTTYTVTYKANGAGAADVVDNYAEGANVTLRPATTFTYDGYTFSEWNTQADGEGDSYDAGDVVENIQDNIVLYAIWTENPVSDEQWVLTSLADLTESDVFVIVGNNGSNYAMSNDNGTSSAPSAVAVTVANDAIMSTVDATIQWNISGNANDGYTFYPNGSTSTWLYCTAANNGVRVGTNNANTFKVESGYLVHQGTSRYVGIYNSQDWRCYTTINNNITGQTFAFYKKVTGGVVPPSITANNVEIEYNATSGNITYTINNEPDPVGELTAAIVEGGTIANLTLGTIANNTVPFTCDANSTGTARTATITLTYTYDTDQTVTKDVIVTQDGNPNATMTIAEVRAQGTGSVVTTGVVTSCVGTTGYIQDATAAICVYGTTLTVGDEIRVSGTLSTYNGLLEITSPQVTVISSGNTTDPELMTIAEAVASTNQGWYIRIEEAVVTAISGQNTTIAQGESTIVVRGISGVEIAVNDVISLNGNIGCYNGNQIANPQNVEVQANTEPSVTVTPSVISAPFDGTEGTIAITYENIPGLYDFDYYFCDAEGNELLDTDPAYPGDWIYAEIQENDGVYSVEYLIDANDGDARTAYFKVYFEEYYAIVTVNQEAYVAPVLDYATLPFEFDGGRADIETTDGLTQEGLDTDYNNSPKLKFNTTGDWVLLHFEGTPGELAFDIKGNSFSGGTFTVQTSEDGDEYTDFVTFTELGTTEHMTYNNLGENVRYIKWIYTEKVNGNVALGNITLDEPAAPVPSITVEFDEIEVTATGEDDYAVITYENLEINDVSDFGIQFYDATGAPLNEQPDWIAAEVTTQIGEEGYFVFYVIEDNDGEARTAYFKVYALDANAELVYSNLVTVSQEAYVTPVDEQQFALFGGDLVEGDYIIYYDGKAMNNVVSSGRLQYAEIEPEDYVITTDNAAIVWHIAQNDEGYWTIYSADANAYAASTGVKNKAQMLEDGTDDMAMWTVTEIDGTYEFVNKANAAGDINANLRNNGAYGFACYATGTGGALSLYKYTETVATYTMEIAGYGNSTNGGYYLIASPVVAVAPTADNGFLTDAYDLYYFDQAEEDEWRNYEAKPFNLVSGKGYLYASQETTTLTFTGIPYDGDGIVTLVKDDDAALAGFNLVGNPFNETAFVDRDEFYVMNPETGADIIPAETNEIAAMQGIFVIAEEEGETLTFSTMEPGKSANLALNLTQGRGVVDRTIVRFGEGRQLPKFQLNPNSTKLYIPQGNQNFAVVRSNGQGEMPVNFKAAEDGIYTISIEAEDLEMNYMHLIDNMTGADVDLLANPSYTFEARTSDYAARFRLVFSATDVEENSEEAFAYYADGQIVVNNANGASLQVVDVMGRVIKSQNINGCTSINMNGIPGVYMLRLVNGENVRVQKVVVR